MTATALEHAWDDEEAARPVGGMIVGLVLGAVALGAIAQVSFEAAAAIFMLGFPILAWSRPDAALAVALAAAPFPFNVSPAFVNVSVAELCVTILFAIAVIRSGSGRAVRFGPTLMPVAIYFAVCFVASIAYWRGSSAITSLLQMTIYLVMAVCVFASVVERKRDLLPALYVLVAVGVGVAALIVAGISIAGLHKNNLGASLSVAFVVAVELWFSSATSRRGRLWMSVALAVLAAGLFMSLSRGAWAGALVGSAIIIYMRRQYGLLLRLVIAGVPLLALCWSMLPEAAQDYATEFSRGAGSVESRFANAHKALEQFAQNPLIGMGVGFRKEADATNIVLFTLAESGILGLAAFLWIHVVLLKMARRGRHGLELHDRLLSLLILGVALVASRFVHGLVDHYWSRGALIVAWSAAGMATLAHAQLQHRDEGEPENDGELMNDSPLPEGHA